MVDELHENKRKEAAERWKGTTSGTEGMHRVLGRLIRLVGLRTVYAIAALFVVPVAVIINSSSRKAIYKFHRKSGRSKLEAVVSMWKSHFVFSRVVIDRFAAFAGIRFDMEIEGYDYFGRLVDEPEGFAQLSSHTGGYEMAGFFLKSNQKPIKVLVFGGEKESIRKGRQNLFKNTNVSMIFAEGDGSMAHVFEMNRALDDGEILSMPADRLFGSSKSFIIPFLGEPARFPQGPFMVVASKNVPAIFVAVMREKTKKYRVIVHPLEWKAGDLKLPVKKRAEIIARQYAEILENTVKRYPFQWFNFYDFWT